MDHEMEKPTEQNHFYLFVNSKSGGGWGQRYLTLGNKLFTYQFQHSPTTHVRFIDLFDTNDRSKVFEEIRNRVQKQCSKRDLEVQAINRSESINVGRTNIRIVICGGDGTIMWVVQETLNHKINTEFVTFGILPIGTGNDFSRSLGWGASPIHFSQNQISNLHQVVKKWVKAETSFYDIWDVELETYPQGCFYDIKNQQQIKKDQKVLKKSFSNYCGMGLEARVVYTVQKHRTSFAFLNKVVYGCIGFCNFFKAMRKLSETVEEFRESQTSDGQDEHENNKQIIKRKAESNSNDGETSRKLKLPNNNTSQRFDTHEREDSVSTKKRHQPKINPKGKRKSKQMILEADLKQDNRDNPSQKIQLLNKRLEEMTIKQPMLSQRKEQNDENINQFELEDEFLWKTIRIRNGYRGIVALNCPSYMAGLRHVWETRKVGTKTTNQRPTKPLNFLPQSYNDGLIQFVGYKSELNLALQRIVRSGGKMAQGTGPYQILMKQPCQQYPQIQSFIQIDGQSVKVMNLKKITIKKTDKIKNSRIKVMVNTQQK